MTQETIDQVLSDQVVVQRANMAEHGDFLQVAKTEVLGGHFQVNVFITAEHAQGYQVVFYNDEDQFCSKAYGPEPECCSRTCGWQDLNI